MSYTIGKTKFRSTAYGVGTLCGYDPVHGKEVLQIDFPNRGIISFAASAVKAGYLKLVETEPQQPRPVAKIEKKPVDEKTAQKTIEKKINSIANCIFSDLVEEPNVQPPTVSSIVAPGDSVVQYDSANKTIGEKNIIEAFDCDDVVIFNESYVIIGSETRAHKVSATYDLTVIGSLSADEIYVNGTLTVIGSIEANKLVCFNSLLCQGDINADYIYIGKDLVADSINCVDFSCYGNAVVRTTINIDKSSHTRKTMIACEGIIGAGEFAAVNAIANEYFEFDGDAYGRIVELDTEKVLRDITLTVVPMQTTEPTIDFEQLSIDQALKMMSERLSREYGRMGSCDKKELLELTNMLSSSAISELNNVDSLFRYLTSLLEKTEIDDIGDYLLIAYAKKKLPEELYHHKCIEYVDDVLLPKAVDSLDDLDFEPSSVRKIAQSLYIIVQLDGMLPLAAESLYDKVFSAIGLRFSTVKNIVSRVATSRDIVPVASITSSENVEASTEDTPVPTSKSNDNDGYRPNPVVACASQDEFLAKTLSDVGKSFTMTNDEIVRLGSVRIRTVGDFLAVDAAFIKDLYKKKPFLARHLITVWKKMKAANEHIT